MHTVYRKSDGGGRLVAVKGSPSEVLALCRWCQERGNIVPLTTDHRAAIGTENDRMAGDALRVLGVAYSHADTAEDALTQGLTWVGLVSMTDPLRPGMNELVSVLRRAGIRAIMITDIFPGLALGLEPAEADVLDEPPRDPQEPIIAARDFKRLVFASRLG
jgi:Ca2+-transporting ATPase